MENFAKLWKALPPTEEAQPANNSSTRVSPLSTRHHSTVGKVGDSVENFPRFSQEMETKPEICFCAPNRFRVRFGLREECFTWNDSRFGATSQIVSRGTKRHSSQDRKTSISLPQ